MVSAQGPVEAIHRWRGERRERRRPSRPAAGPPSQPAPAGDRAGDVDGGDQQDGAEQPARCRPPGQGDSGRHRHGHRDQGGHGPQPGWPGPKDSITVAASSRTTWRPRCATGPSRWGDLTSSVMWGDRVCERERSLSRPQRQKGWRCRAPREVRWSFSHLLRTKKKLGTGGGGGNCSFFEAWIKASLRAAIFASVMSQKPAPQGAVIALRHFRGPAPIERTEAWPCCHSPPPS